MILLAIPAAYALGQTDQEVDRCDVLLPLHQDAARRCRPVAALHLRQYLGLLDNINYLLILYTAMNLPIAVWMMRSFLADIPVELFEAAASMAPA